MKSLELDVPDDVYSLVGEAEIRTIAREALVVRLYELEKIGSGRAAQLLGISRREFLTDVLSRYGVYSFDENVDVTADASLR